MKLFECQVCRNALHFDNTVCVGCDSAVAYLPEQFAVTVVEPSGDGLAALAAPSQVFSICNNAHYGGCNWLVPFDAGPVLCVACQHNRTIPDLSVPGNTAKWAQIETSKRHLFYSLMRLALPCDARSDGTLGLRFDFVADARSSDGQVSRATTGHADGVITLNIAEADDAERERRRLTMGEPYRTILGHLRHEIGHYYWARLVDGTSNLTRFRALFGDERPNYSKALASHYAVGPPADWQQTHISAYATAHPWEDFAETWAHYMHIVDALETARAFGIRVSPRIEEPAQLQAKVDFDPYRAIGLRPLLDAWVPLTVAVNSINRSLGMRDLYPFVLSDMIVAKLEFVHRLVRHR